MPSVMHFCDGKYDCVDRSDEGSGSCIGGRRLADDSLVLDEPLDENERERAALWALAFVFLGIPATWAVKEAALRWFVACFGKEERGVERSSSSTSLSSDDEDVIKMLEFICEMVVHVEESEAYETHKPKLMRLFEQVHNTAAWSDNATIIFDMGHLLFDAKMELIDEFHIVMNDLERTFHNGVELELNLCLKHDLGNRMVKAMLWSTEPPGIRKLQKLLPVFVLTMWQSQWCKAVRIYVGLFVETVSYYVDFVKDWIIFALLYNYIDRSSFALFEVQLVTLLGVFLVVPEIIRGIYFAHNYKILFDIHSVKFPLLPELCMKVVVVILSPFVPAVLLWERGKMTYKNLKVQALLSTRIEACLDSPRKRMEKPMIDAFKEDFRIYHSSLRVHDRLLRIVVDTKYLEASTETIFQYILQLMVVLVVSNSTRVQVTDGLESVFFSQVGVLLYVSLVLSFISLISTRVKIESWSKFGFFQTMAKLEFGLHSLLALVTKVFGFVFLFAPSLGLFGFGVHFAMEQVQFAKDDYVLDVEGDGREPQRVRDIWPATSESYTSYTFVNLPTLYIFFLFFLPWQCFALYILKWRLVPPFASSKSLSSRLVHVVSCITYPSIFRDWDRPESEQLSVYDRRWRKVHQEHLLMSCWHCAINVIMTLPTVWSAAAVISRHRQLASAGFAETPAESEAYVTSVCLLFSPLAFILLAWLEWRLLETYYRTGHPWSRIFVELPSTRGKFDRSKSH